MFRGYYWWRHMFIWSGVQIEILWVTEHDICSSGAVTFCTSSGAKFDIFTLNSDAVQLLSWQMTEHKVIIVQYYQELLFEYLYKMRHNVPDKNANIWSKPVIECCFNIVLFFTIWIRYHIQHISRALLNHNTYFFGLVGWLEETRNGVEHLETALVYARIWKKRTSNILRIWFTIARCQKVKKANS